MLTASASWHRCTTSTSGYFTSSKPLYHAPFHQTACNVSSLIYQPLRQLTQKGSLENPAQFYLLEQQRYCLVFVQWPGQKFYSTAIPFLGWETKLTLAPLI